MTATYPAELSVSDSDASPEGASGDAEEPSRELPLPEAVLDAPSWERFPGSGRLQSWARELRAACVAGESAAVAWELTGRAAIIISDEMNACYAALRRVAADAGMHFVFVPEDDVVDLPPPEALRQMTPLLVCLEPGRWMLEPQDGDDANRHSFASESGALLARIHGRRVYYGGSITGR
ncbi:MAG: hypothetical protein M3Z05_20155 [Gemmatimonadota bacterium]|nr:hypothetical protein [Gemmatimonadota bacterium]